MQRTFRAALAMLALALLIACGGPATVSQSQTVDGLTITLEQPANPQPAKSYDLLVTLKDSAGKSVEGATVYIDLVMPAMPMGANQPIADPLGGGRYKATATYTMDGQWRITVHATANGKEYSAAFEQQVKVPG